MLRLRTAVSFVCVTVPFAALALGSLSHAAPPIGTSKPGPAPRPTPTPTIPPPPPPPIEQGLVVTGFKNVPLQSGLATTQGTTAVALGAYKYAVDITNASDDAVTKTLTVKRRIPNAEAFTTSLPVSLGARQSTTVTFVDNRGLEDGCNPSTYDLLFDGKTARKGKVTPACTFQVSSSGAPRSAQTSGVLYHDGARLRSMPKCNEKLDVAARVVNAGVGFANVRLRLPFPGNQPETSTLVPNADNRYADSPSAMLAGQQGTELFTTEGEPFRGREGDYPLTIQRLAYTGMTGLKTETTTPVASPSWSINVKRTCTVTAALE